MNVIHIGLGVRGRHWVDIVRDAPESTSVGCVDPEPSALEWAKTQSPNLKNACYQDLDKALKSIKADAAIIASPPALHGAHAVRALEAGLAVMIEKPFASNLEEAVRVVEASRRTGWPIMVAQNYRHAPCERTLQQLMREDKVGTITHVSCVDRRSRPATDNYLARVDYAQVLDVGAHHFDSLRSILGVNPVSVMARCSKAPWSEYQHGSTTQALLEMGSNIHVQYYGSLTSNRYEHALWIEGDKGVLWTDRARVWWRKRGWRFFLPLRLRKVPKGDALKYPREGTATLLDQLQAAATRKQQPETNGEDNLWTLSMIEAAILSEKTGKTVRVADLFSAAGIERTTAPVNGQRMSA
jgi:predicted dehydrogenase